MALSMIKKVMRQNSFMEHTMERRDNQSSASSYPIRSMPHPPVPETSLKAIPIHPILDPNKSHAFE